QFGEPYHAEAGEVLVRMGQPSTGMWVILSGVMQILRRDGMGHRQMFSEAHPRYFVAEVSSISGGPTLVDAVAVTPMDLLRITSERLRALLIADAELSEKIMRALILRRVSLI